VKQPAKVAFGGTFNCVHDGHRTIFHEALAQAGGSNVLVGLSSDKFAIRMKGASKPYEVRKRQLSAELARIFRKFEIRKIEDELGFAAKEKGLEALVVSGETERNGKKVNAARKKKGLKLLRLVVVPLVIDRHGRRLSCRNVVMHKTHLGKIGKGKRSKAGETLWENGPIN
jgi:pantetheine-phosphate adenylyltransferase